MGPLIGTGTGCGPVPRVGRNALGPWRSLATNLKLSQHTSDPVLFRVSVQLCRCWQEAGGQWDLTRVAHCQLRGTEGEKVFVSQSMQERINKV